LEELGGGNAKVKHVSAIVEIITLIWTKETSGEVITSHFSFVWQGKVNLITFKTRDIKITKKMPL
jgi:hypothetical protein